MAHTQLRLNNTQNLLMTSPVPQGTPELPGLPAGTARLPNAKPIAALRRHQPTLHSELPNPATGRATIRPTTPSTPNPNRFPTPQNRVQTRLDNLRSVALERNAERREKADRDPATRTPTAYLTDLNLVYLGKPDIPEVSALAFGTREVAQRTPCRTLTLNLRMVRMVGLNITGKEAN